MSDDVWLAFVTTSLVLCFYPGAGRFMEVGQILTHAKRSIALFAAEALSVTLS